MSDPLFQVLELRGIKLQWLARQVGLDPSALSRAKSGERHIPLHARKRIAEVLSLPESMLFAAPVSTEVEPHATEVEEPKGEVA